MISQIFDGGSFRVLALFAISPGSRFRRKEIKDRTRMNNAPLDNALSKLVSSGVIKSENGFYYSLNMESVYLEPLMKLISSQHTELKKLPLSVYLLLADAVAALSTVKRPEAWLFGSYSKLVYTEKSDVDIALLVPPEFKHKERIKNILRKLEKHYGKKIEAHFFDAHAFYRNKKDPLVNGILKDGVRIL